MSYERIIVLSTRKTSILDHAFYNYMSNWQLILIDVIFCYRNLCRVI